MKERRVESEGKARLKLVGQCKGNYSSKVRRNLWHMSKEEEVLRIQNKLDAKDDLICSPQTKNFALQKYLSHEEESKRKTLLNYISSTKDRTNTSESEESFGNSNLLIFGTILIYQFFDLIELHLQREMHLITAALRDIENTME